MALAYYLYQKARKKQNQRGAADRDIDLDPGQRSRSEAPISSQIGAPSGLDVIHRSQADDTEKIAGISDDVEARKQEAREMRTYRWRIIAGLFFPFTVQSLNITMIAGALPFIASDFHQFAQLNWIISAYNLTSATFIPAWGQLADIFGRYTSLQVASVFMIVGSAMCAGAPTTAFPMFLAGRGLQGVGSAGIMILTKIILADKVSLKENAKNNTIFTLIAGVGFGVGPVVGGYLTSVTWRWCFIINIPLAAAGLVVTHWLMRPMLLGPQDIYRHDETEYVSSSEAFTKRLATIDFGGQVLFLLGMGLFVLALTWAGASYPWSSVKIIAPLVVGTILVLIFFFWEYSLLPGKGLMTTFPHQQAMIPLNILFTRNAGLLMYINFITGMAMYAVFYFSDLYFTIVENFDSGKAGTNLLYYTPGLGVGAYLAMFNCNIWPRKTWYPLALGTVIEAVGITLIATSLKWGYLPTVYGMLGLTGVGTGLRLMPGTLHGVGYYRKNIATIVSLMSLAISLGGTLASTIMLNIFNNKMNHAGISLVHGASSASSFSQIESLSLERQIFLRGVAKDGIILAFYAITSFMWLGVVASMFMGNVDIKKDSNDADTHADGDNQMESLTKGAYILSFI